MKPAAILQPFVYAHVHDSSLQSIEEFMDIIHLPHKKNRAKLKIYPFETPFEPTWQIFLQDFESENEDPSSDVPY